MFTTTPLPQYPEIRLTLNPWRIGKYIKEFNPTHIHIATEGPLGFAAVLYCRIRNWQYTTSYHTNFGQYIEKMSGIPQRYTNWYFQWFHDKATYVLVPSTDAKSNLPYKRADKVVVWGRGVDKTVFNPQLRMKKSTGKSKILCVSRVSVEKNLRAFLDIHLPTPYTKILVGGGPEWNTLRLDYANDSDLIMPGSWTGTDLAEFYANADVFIFPSLTDTFGIVMLEALSCGTPVIAYKTAGALEVIQHGVNGFLLDPHERFEDYIPKAMELDRQNIVNLASKYTWAACTKVFEDHLVPIK
jgi:glycosyltransferase involved in cell wall biosynthesis